MAAQLFPLIDRTSEVLQQQNLARQAQVQQQQLAIQNQFQQHAAMLQQASTQSELALRQQEMTHAAQLQPLQAQVLQQEIERNKQASAAALFSLQHARDLAPLEMAQAQATLGKTKVSTFNDVQENARQEMASRLQQKLGASQLDQNAQRLVDEHVANALTAATLPKTLRGLAIAPQLQAGTMDQQTADSILGAPESPKDLSALAADIGQTLDPQARLQFLVNLERAKQPTSIDERLMIQGQNEVRSKSGQPPMLSQPDQALANMNALMMRYQQKKGSQQQGSQPDFSTAPDAPMLPTGKVDKSQLKAGTVYKFPNGPQGTKLPLLYTGQSGANGIVPPSRLSEFFQPDPKNPGAYVPVGQTAATSDGESQ